MDVLVKCDNKTENLADAYHRTMFYKNATLVIYLKFSCQFNL